MHPHRDCDGQWNPNSVSIMEDIAQKIADKDYPALIDTCEALEFEVLPGDCVCYIKARSTDRFCYRLRRFLTTVCQ